MKKIKLLVKSIVNGSIGTQVAAGVVAVTVLGGVSFGGYATYKHFNETKKIEASIAKKKEDISIGIEVLEENIANLPEEEDTTSLKTGLEELKAMDLENDYENAYEKCESLISELHTITDKYKREMTTFNDEIGKLDMNLFNEEERNELNSLIQEYSTIYSNSKYKEYKSKYEEIKSKYDELLAQAQSRVENNGELAEGESDSSTNSDPSSDPTNSGSTNSGSTNSGSSNSVTSNGNTSSTNSKPNSGSSNSGSTNSGSSNSGSTNSGSSNSESSNSGSSNNDSATQEESKPQTPSIPSGYKSDVASQIVSKHSNVNTNNYDTSSNYFSQTSEMYSSYSSIASRFFDGSLSQSSAIAELQGVSGEFNGFKFVYGNSQVLKFNFNGCDAKEISDYIYSSYSYIKPSFVSCSVYYDSSSNTSTVWFVKVATETKLS